MERVYLWLVEGSIPKSPGEETVRRCGSSDVQGCTDLTEIPPQISLHLAGVRGTLALSISDMLVYPFGAGLVCDAGVVV